MEDRMVLVGEYLEAIEALERVKNEATAMVRSLEDAANSLSSGKWKHTGFTNSGVGFPPHISSGISVDVRQVSDIQGVAEKAGQYHTCLGKAQDLWRRIPEAQRRGLKQVEP